MRNVTLSLNKIGKNCRDNYSDREECREAEEKDIRRERRNQEVEAHVEDHQELSECREQNYAGSEEHQDNSVSNKQSKKLAASDRKLCSEQSDCESRSDSDEECNSKSDQDKKSFVNKENKCGQEECKCQSNEQDEVKHAKQSEEENTRHETHSEHEESHQFLTQKSNQNQHKNE